jgi:nucleotide-binding universal stress UspA family protein
MKTLNIPSALPAVGVAATRWSPVVIATDGRTQSDSALVMARLFAGDGDALRLVCAIRPIPIIPDGTSVVTPDLLEVCRVDLQRDVEAQMNRAWDASTSVDLREGDPATVVAQVGHDSNATMIVCGLGRHRVTDRVFGDETALRLMRIADAPVYAVAAGTSHAPTCIVVAADFSETSLRAARLALDVAAPGATIYLAHVAPRDSMLGDLRSWGSSYKHDAGEALRRTREQLRVPAGMTVQNILLQGDSATELLAFATSVNADLIATGSHGHGFVARMLIGSVTTRLVRCATCSVLTVPFAAAMTHLRTRTSALVHVDVANDTWASELEVLTQRNAGRRATLEVDDPEIDAQAQVTDYPFLGAAYDRHDGRIELMFGDSEGGGRHLTRGISGVTSIMLLRDELGRDVSVRIAHGAGLTLVTFTTSANP